jgi:SAM-dependent methyltransferase
MVTRMAGGRFDYIGVNAAAWDARHEDQRQTARRGWSAPEPRWGIFHVPEETARVLPDDLDGKAAVELGCGTAYVSAWLARRGASPIGVDPSPSQLGIARASQEEFGLSFPLIRASGEQVPLIDGSADLVISEYGAAIWADPYHWIPEAARLLRPGGELVFLGNSMLLMLCVPDEDNVPATTQLLRPSFGMHRFEWPDDPTIEFHLSHGDWIRLFRQHGLEVLDLIELRPPPDAVNSAQYGFVETWWADRWPCEEVWRARKTG